MFRSAALLFLALLTAPATAQVATVPVDDSFVGGSTGWTRSKGELHLAWKPVSGPGGAIMVCGAWAITDADVIKGARDMLSEARVVINDVVVLQNLMFFTRARDADLNGVGAACQPTAAPSPVRDARIVWGDGTFRGKR